MSHAPSEPWLHGGPRRIVELAARALGYLSGQATLVESGERRVVAAVGPVEEDTDALLDQVALELLTAGVVTAPDALGVPLHDEHGRVVGALCLAGRGGAEIDPEEQRVLRAYGDVLADQVALLRHVVDLRDDGSVVRELEHAIYSGEIRPWYQPVVHLASGALVGLEALARWHRSSGEVEMPGAFIGLAEETGLVTRLDLAVMGHAVRDLARWRRHLPDLRVSVNFSGRHLDDDGWVAQVRDLADAAGVPASNIDLELTESARPDDIMRGGARLQELRDLGYTIWFDDFGTGWSELQHLVQLPIDGVKIDRFFAEALGSRADAVVRALVTTADELGLGTTIEGISTPDHAERALALGCDLAQGFLWSFPLPVAEVDDLVRSPNPGFRGAAR